jgi:putative ATPase
MSEVRYEARLAGGVTLRVKKGDLTAEAVDAIVNAANERLAHGGGLAGAIVRAGGEVIQWESDEKAPVPTGRAVATGAGALPCKRVIHAVGPVWARYPEAEADRLLASAVQAALDVASAEGLASISIPAISSGIFGFPKERCAVVTLEAVEGYFADHRETTVAEVNLCNFDEPTTAIFEAAVRTRYDGGV